MRRLSGDKRLLLNFTIAISFVLLMAGLLNAYEKRGKKQDPLFSGDLDYKIDRLSGNALLDFTHNMGFNYPASTKLKEFTCFLNPDGSVKSLKVVLESKLYPEYQRVLTYSKQPRLCRIDSIPINSMSETNTGKNTSFSQKESESIESRANESPELDDKAGSQETKAQNRVSLGSFASGLDMFLNSREDSMAKKQADFSVLALRMKTFTNDETLKRAWESKSGLFYVRSYGNYLPYSGEDKTSLCFLCESVEGGQNRAFDKKEVCYELELY